MTMPAREKEMEEDYGYIGEPDLGELQRRRLWPASWSSRRRRECGPPRSEQYGISTRQPDRS